MKSLYSILSACVLLTGCTKSAVSNNPIASETNNYEPPIVSYEGKTPFERLGTVDPVNRGFNIDLNGDGKIDFAILRGNTVYFKKGESDGSLGQEMPILVIKGDIKAYRIDKIAGQERPVVIFFNNNDDGFFQPNLGTNSSGIPYFGDIEGLH